MPTTISEVTQELRTIIQNSELQDIWIHGRISEVRPAQRGVLNFTIEGNGQKIKCVIFANRRSLQSHLPSLGSNIFVKGQIHLYSMISSYRFKVTDIHRHGDPFPTPCVSINDLTATLQSILRDHPAVEVQGEIAEVFDPDSGFTILKLKDGQSDEKITCVIPPAIEAPFALETGKRVHVSGPFEIFTPTRSYQIRIGNASNITQAVGPPTNECRNCRQRFSNLQDQLCHICYHARLTYEGIVVGAVQRYFDTPKFANFTTQREYEIRFGVNIMGRADVVLLNSEGNPVAIAECKRIEYDGNDGIVQLKGYINPTVAKLGLFADNTDPYEWTFIKRNNERNRYDEITRSQFERELGVEPVPEIPPTKTQFELLHGNIIESEVDAIVNAADSRLIRGTGVDGAIRDAGGEGIDRECQEIFDREGVCPPGKAVITTGGNLLARYVIHAVGPIWQGGNRGEPESLADCYINSLQLAVDNGIRSIAFTAISTGNFGYPIEQAAPVALRSVKEFVEQAHQNNQMVPEHIQFVLFDEEAYTCYVNAFSRLGLGLFSVIG